MCSNVSMQNVPITINEHDGLTIHSSGATHFHVKGACM